MRSCTRVRTRITSFLIPEIMETDFLYVSDWTHKRLYQVSLTGGTMTSVDFPLAVGPVGVLFNVRTRRVIWTDGHSVVHSVSMRGTEYNKVANLGVYMN